MNLELQNKTAETAYNVYVTKDYSIFRRLVGNRDIPESRISKIVESIQTIGWIHNPIIVNEKMEVIDGQGRLTELQRLKTKINKQEELNASIQMKINELASLDNALEVADTFGLEYNNSNVRTINE